MFLEHIYSRHHRQNLEREPMGGGCCRWRVMAEARHPVNNRKLPVQMLRYQHIPQIARVSARLVNRELMSGRLNYQIANSCPGRSGGTMARYDASCPSPCCQRGLARVDGEAEEQEVCHNLTSRQKPRIFDLRPVRFRPLFPPRMLIKRLRKSGASGRPPSLSLPDLTRSHREHEEVQQPR